MFRRFIVFLPVPWRTFRAWTGARRGACECWSASAKQT